MAINHWIDVITHRIPISFYKKFIHKDVVCLFYHTISDKPLPHIKYLYDSKTEAMFERDLVYIKENYHTVNYQQVYDHFIGEFDVKPNAIFISFDDGFRECFSIARHLLKLYEIQCTFFVTTNFIDNKNMFYRNKVSLSIVRLGEFEQGHQEEIFSWIRHDYNSNVNNMQEFVLWIKSITQNDEEIIDHVCEKVGVDIQEYLRVHSPYMTRDQISLLAKDGFTIGAHSMSHRLLSKLTYEELEQEITGSCRMIQEITQNESIPFSFPFYGHQIDKNYLREIQDENQEVGLFFDSSGLRESSDFILDRIWADPPEWDQSGKSNIEPLIKLAYREILFSKLRNSDLAKLIH